MKLGVLTVLLGDQPFDKACEYLAKQGVQALEIGCGGFPGKAHADPDILLNDEKAFKDFKKTIDRYGFEISAFSCHGNPVHPDINVATKADEDFKKAVLLAEKAGVSRVCTFSGCPGDTQFAKYPNWVTCPWPDDFLKILDYQWNECLVPYWKKASAFAREHGVDKICFEMHPGFCVYNPETLLKLRSAVGPEIGANFDPSHLFWQGIDPARAIIALKDCMFHFHAKDTRIDPYNTAVNGVLDTKNYGDIENRAWVFRTVGYGHDDKVWKDIVSALRTIDYDFVMSIEHEDGLMSPNEGLKKAIEFLKDAMTFEDKGAMYWA